MPEAIIHEPQNHRFTCTVETRECMVEYEMKTPGTMDIYRTFVHADLRGKGIAEMLMKSASEYAKAQGIAVIPSCSYAVVFFKKHSEYASLLAPDVDLENGGSCRIPNRN